MSYELADLVSQFNGLLSEVSVLVVPIALTLGCTAALGASMHPTSLPAPNGWGSAECSRAGAGAAAGRCKQTVRLFLWAHGVVSCFSRHPHPLLVPPA